MTEVEQFTFHCKNISFEPCEDVTWTSIVNIEKTLNNISFWLSTGRLQGCWTDIFCTFLFSGRWFNLMWEREATSVHTVYEVHVWTYFAFHSKCFSECNGNFVALYNLIFTLYQVDYCNNTCQNWHVEEETKLAVSAECLWIVPHLMSNPVFQYSLLLPLFHI